MTAAAAELPIQICKLDFVDEDDKATPTLSPPPDKKRSRGARGGALTALPAVAAGLPAAEVQGSADPVDRAHRQGGRGGRLHQGTTPPYKRQPDMENMGLVSALFR